MKPVRNFLRLSLVLTMLSVISVLYTNAGPWVQPRSNRNSVVPGEFIVKYRQELRPDERADIIGKVQAKSLRAQTAQNWEHIKVTEDRSTDEVIELLSQDPAVEYVQPNYRYHMVATPNDPKFAKQWSLANTGQTLNGSYDTNNPGTAGDDLSLSSAWDINTDCTKTLIAVVDTGVNYSHEDLLANMWDGGANYPNHGYDFVDNDNDPKDLNGHGTHVSGTIGASGNNGVGIAGICWKAKIIAVRGLDATGAGTTSSIVSALQFAKDRGAKIVNLSLSTDVDDPTFKSTLQKMSDAGVIIVVAAGNESANVEKSASPAYPCNYTSIANLLCVGAVDQSFKLADFSNYGSKNVAIAAPGTNIVSTYAGIESVTQVSFQSAGSLNWTTSGGAWAYAKHNLSDGSSGGSGTSAYDMLVNPSNWNGTSAQYSPSVDARAYRTLDLSSFDAVQLDVSLFYDVGRGDYLNIKYLKSVGDPFAAGGISLDQISGSSNGESTSLSYDLSNCRVANCSLGFQLKSDSSTQSYGVGIYEVALTAMKLNNNTYAWLDGTSMATPQVVGVAALVQSANPNMTAGDVMQALKMGATSLASLSNHIEGGRVLNALGALTYIAPPNAVTAVQE